MDTLESTVEPVSYVEPAAKTEEFEAAALDLAHVGSDKKWQVIKDYMTDRIAYYRDNLAGLDITNESLAKVGEKYLVCSLVAMELEALMNKVDVTTEAVRESRRRS